MTENEAKELGAKAGRDELYNEEGIDAIRNHQRSGHDDWDEAAISAGAHQCEGVSEEHRAAYYEAYNSAANAAANAYLATDES